MTINQYLYTLEILKIRRSRSFERYVRAHNRASAPTAAYINTDGITSRSGYNGREDKLIKAADALARYDKATDIYDAFYKQLEDNLERLERSNGWRERVALELIYIDHIGAPKEKRRNGLCLALGVRTKAEAGEIVKAAKEHLTEILIAQGIPIEN